MSFFGLLTERFSGKGRKERRKERRKMKKERKKGKGREERRKNFSKIIGWPLGYEEKKKKSADLFITLFPRTTKGKALTEQPKHTGLLNQRWRFSGAI